VLAHDGSGDVGMAKHRAGTAGSGLISSGVGEVDLQGATEICGNPICRERYTNADRNRHLARKTIVFIPKNENLAHYGS
jgi:hypothetical protein